ncbi:NB-ARC domain-containing protein [Allokutzneria sp. A3M-2-11 16]|uniref:NB-ARC domain-containing protein n=1 Tax=Allokutzneria sp. A3M-2-11 16 TaxID=2962043 RepID=UPI0020B69939|nr:NB-ARC domain-containing protein [Allokutzneria sp. A3M-2-11 16]MCP3801388.1 NB-ARC domain-containing protein [Allokutzneria sp. A3M-2-11 16]
MSTAGSDGPHVRNEVRDVHGISVQAGTHHGDNHIHLPSAADVLPRQVPASPEVWVDREDHLSILDTLGSGKRIAVVQGPEGVGKTALSHKWAGRVAARFTGGQLYVDFAAFRQESGSMESAVGEALASCLRACGVPQWLIPDGLAARSSMLRSRMPEAALIVLDDVIDSAQVGPFVPNSAGSAVLVTSRHRLAELVLDDAEYCELTGLPEADALLLLRKTVGAQRIDADAEAARRIVLLCGGMPIALRVVAGRLKHERHLRLADLVAQAEAATGLDFLTIGRKRIVAAVFDNAYRNLSEPLARFYRGLGVLPVLDITPDVAALVSDDAVALLGELVDVNLIEERDDRFRFHGLIRRHAEERAREEETPESRDHVLRQVLGYYLAYTAFADQAVMGTRTRIADHDKLKAGHRNPFSDKTEALEWLDSERANLLAVLRASAERGWHEPTWQLAEALVALYFNRRYIADWLEATDLGVAAARAVGAERAEARLRITVSRAYTDLGNLDRTRQELEIALDLLKDSGDNVLLGSVWEFYGRYWDNVDPVRGEEAYLKSIDFNAKAKEWRGVALATYFLGGNLLRQGRVDEALEKLDRALEGLWSEGRMAGRVLASRGEAFAALGDLTRAASDLRAAIATLVDSKVTHYEAQARVSLAEVLVRQGDMAAAKAEFERALEIYQSVGSPEAAKLEARLAELDQ